MAVVHTTTHAACCASRASTWLLHVLEHPQRVRWSWKAPWLVFVRLTFLRGF